MAENTAMTKVYKMPVLKAFIRPDGLIATSVSAERLLEVWKKFFSESFNWRDLEPDLTLKKFSEISDSRHLEKIYHMPVKFLTRISLWMKVRCCTLHRSWRSLPLTAPLPRTIVT